MGCGATTKSRRADGATSNGPEAAGTRGARRPRSRYPERSFPRGATFADVGVKKKSFCGSIDSNKPCLHIDFGRFGNANVPGIEALIGSRYVTLNNSIQDKSYIKQTLGYRLLGMAGLPNSRCNYARVFVNGTLIGQGVGGVNSPGIYVNAEPIMKRYIERNFNGNMKGNLYEIEHHDDFVEERLRFIGVESLSKFEDKADLKFACSHIKANGLAGADQMFDMDQFLKIYAMEFFLKHWDGYADNTNNTYHLQRRNCCRGAGRGQHQVQDDPVGDRPDTSNPASRSSWAVTG